MCACIYFKEDATLGVVGRNDKNLKVLSVFVERQEVEMHWRIGGKLQLYHGQIIKVHENEEVLTKFAKRADSKVLKSLRTEVDGHGKIDTSETPQELFNLMLTEEAIGSKRKPKPTEKSKEITEQEETLNPKKKKKNEEKAHVVQSKKEKAEKGNVHASKFETKKMEEASSLQAESEIAGLLSQLLSVDTHDSTESETNLRTCIDDNASSLVKDDAVPHSAVTSQKDVHVVQSPTPTDSFYTSLDPHTEIQRCCSFSKAQTLYTSPYIYLHTK